MSQTRSLSRNFSRERHLHLENYFLRGDEEGDAEEEEEEEKTSEGKEVHEE